MKKDLILKGESLKFTSGLQFKHLTVDEVISLDFNIYMYFIGCFLFKPQDLIVPLWGKGIYYQDISQYELFMMQVKENEQLFIEVFKYITDCDFAYITYVEELESDSIIFAIEGKQYCMNESSFNSIYDYYKKMHNFEHAPKRYFKGEKTKKSILDEDYEEYLEKLEEKKESSSLSDMVSFITITNHRDWDKVYSYPIGRLYEEYVKTSRKESANYKLQAIYAGTIEASKIPQKDLNWHIS